MSEADPNPSEHPDQPTRSVTVVQGIIKQRFDDTDCYLMEFDHGAGQFQPLGGKQDSEDEPLTESLRREISEELLLNAIPGIRTNLLKAGWGLVTSSPTYGVLTRYRFNFFHVTHADFEVTTGEDIHWITREEMAAGHAEDGRPVTSILVDGVGWEVLDGLAATEFSNP